MYRPKAFQVDDPAMLYRFIAEHPLSTFVTTDELGTIATSQLPLLRCERDGATALIGHLARANPQWQQNQRPGAQAVALFVAARAYISPTWYASAREAGRVVPTFDYIAVEARGNVRFVHDEPTLHAFVSALTAQEEARIGGVWSPRTLARDFLSSQLRAIVGVELQVSQIVGSFKLSQNRSHDDIAGVVAGLHALGDPRSHCMADLIASSEPPREPRP